MRPSSAWTRSALALVVLGNVIGTAILFDAASDANAAVVCQHPRKGLVRLRSGACRKNEVTVFDTGICSEDPARRLLMANRAAQGLITLGYVGGPLCRTLDDDLEGCAHAYEIGIHGKGGLFGATACAPLAGKCLPCYPQLEVEGLCRNACQPPIGCSADVTRTQGRPACESVTSPGACAQSWTMTFEYSTTTDLIRATSCYWDSGRALCLACSPSTAPGTCVNTCISAADLPRCRVGGRSYGRCSAHDGNPAACGLFYQLSPLVGTETCWYDTASGDCRGCEPGDESLERCTNGC